MKRGQRSELALLNRLLNTTIEQLATEGGTIEIKITPPSTNGHKDARYGTHRCAWAGCKRLVTGVRCRRHAQLVRQQEAQLQAGRFREPHQRAPMRGGSYNACECGRPKLVTDKECDVCRDLNKHRQAPGR